MPTQTQLMDAQAIKLAVARIAHEIAEEIQDLSSVIVIGIPAGGVGMARQLAGELSSLGGDKVPWGAIDAGMHRDDLASRPNTQLHHTEIPEEIEDREVILADDVIASGRTVRAALDALNSYGRPSRVKLAVLLDRGHRELPIQPDYFGREVDAEENETVKVKWLEEDGEEAVYVEQA